MLEEEELKLIKSITFNEALFWFHLVLGYLFRKYVFVDSCKNISPTVTFHF